jgi:hypothetical protein
MVHLGKGFWLMRSVPGKQDPRETKPFTRFPPVVQPHIRALNDPAMATCTLGISSRETERTGFSTGATRTSRTRSVRCSSSATCWCMTSPAVTASNALRGCATPTWSRGARMSQRGPSDHYSLPRCGSLTSAGPSTGITCSREPARRHAWSGNPRLPDGSDRGSSVGS